MKRTFCISTLVACTLVMLFAGEAAALQTHGGTEGIVVHQLAHIQYLGALGYLIWDIRRSGFTGAGWRHLQWFCRLMIAWNGLAFIGHFAQMALPEAAIATPDGYLSSQLLVPLSFERIVYFLTALDHLLITPGLLFLYLAMRWFYRAETDGNKERG